MSIYIAKEGKNWGPYESKQVSVLVERGSFADNDWAWIEGEADWMPVSEVLKEWEAAETAYRELEFQKEVAKLAEETPSRNKMEVQEAQKEEPTQPAAKPRRTSWWNRHFFFFAFGLGTVGLIALLVLRPPAVAEYNLLQTREGLAFEPNKSEPFDGNAVSHHPNGQMMFKAAYRDGKQHGEMVSFFADGQKQSEGTLVDGQFHGKVIYYHPNGEVQSHYVYQNGEAISRKNWDAVGNMVNRGQ
ncbi:MAG: DUF4339 domain-containing protein [Verrucomicrobia subdivision 3 bacterium]|nr:DUF4339 domain-containing protein [Limisphaerales bacterium]